MRAHIAITSTPAAYTHYEKNRNHSFAVGEPRSAHDRRVKFIVKRTGCTESYRILPVSRRALSRGRIQDSPDTASARGVEPRWAARGIIPTSAAFASARAIVGTLASVLATRPLSSRRRSGRRRLPASLPSVFSFACARLMASSCLVASTAQMARASALQIRTYQSNRHPSCHSQSSPGSVPNSRNDPSCSATS